MADIKDNQTGIGKLNAEFLVKVFIGNQEICSAADWEKVIKNQITQAEEIKQLRASLEFYADKNIYQAGHNEGNFNMPPYRDHGLSKIISDSGKIAQAALKKETVNERD